MRKSQIWITNNENRQSLSLDSSYASQSEKEYEPLIIQDNVSDFDHKIETSTLNNKFGVKNKKATLPPPNPLIQKRIFESEITYSGYGHRLPYEDVKLEYSALQPINDEIVTNNNVQERKSIICIKSLFYSIDEYTVF